MSIMHVEELIWLRAQNAAIESEISRLRMEAPGVDHTAAITRLMRLAENHERHISILEHQLGAKG